MNYLLGNITPLWANKIILFFDHKHRFLAAVKKLQKKNTSLKNVLKLPYYFKKN